jgi:uncharacterized protein (TIGR02246 family)
MARSMLQRLGLGLGLGFGFLVAMLLLLTSAQAASKDCVLAEEEDIAALFDRWSSAVEMQHPDRVTRLYDTDATMIVGRSDAQRLGYAEIRAYYFETLQRDPRVRLQARSIRIGCNHAVDTGTVAVILRGARPGTTETLLQRYTFVYDFNGGSWRIAHHHVSQPSEAVALDRRTQVHAAVPASVGARTAKPGPAVAGFTQRIARPRVSRPKSGASESWGYKAGDWSNGQPTF